MSTDDHDGETQKMKDGTLVKSPKFIHANLI